VAHKLSWFSTDHVGVLLPKIKKIPKNTNGRLAIPAPAGLLVVFPFCFGSVRSADLQTVMTFLNRVHLVFRPAHSCFSEAKIFSCRTPELENVELWSHTNNLVLNRSKSLEVIFSDKRRKHSFQQPPPISTIKRVTTIKILGVFISSNMSVTEHINIITSSACSNYPCVTYPPITRHANGIHPYNYNLPGSCHRKAHVRIKRMVGLHYCH